MISIQELALKRSFRFHTLRSVYHIDPLMSRYLIQPKQRETVTLSEDDPMFHMTDNLWHIFGGWKYDNHSKLQIFHCNGNGHISTGQVKFVHRPF